MFSSWYHNITAVVYKIYLCLGKEIQTQYNGFICLFINVSFNCFNREILKFTIQKRKGRKLVQTNYIPDFSLFCKDKYTYIVDLFLFAVILLWEILFNLLVGSTFCTSQDLETNN